ncbi:MAG: class I SAM-dependent methyltransferase [Nocardioides sp.]|uniref:class I SAM-dependent methyltransferase n=1 Tax=Nocardioides sp. TaxID=35761 RepID=UPI003F11B35C
MVRWWDERVVPRLTDASLRGREVGELRGLTCAGLGGTVIEVGFGSGLNVRWYPAEVNDVWAVEPSDGGWELSERRRARSRVPVERRGLDGQLLAVDDDSADCALVTFSLCTIPDPVRALAELRRVVRPGGSLHFLEHGLSPDPRTARRQRRLEPWQRRLAGGCHLTREPAPLAGAAGWTVETLVHDSLEGPAVMAPWTYLSRGRAR